MKNRFSRTQGFSLVEVIIVSAISTAIFGALFSSFYFTLQVVNISKSKLSAQSIANDRMEYFRSLPYDDVGTISGIPAGTIPQNSTTSLNGIEFAERVLVEYVDDDADGTGASDTNAILSDYKRLKLEYTWEMRGVTNTIALISNIVPRSIETTAGGGSVRINVIDSNSMLLPGAEVRLLNNTTTSTIDVTRFTAATGAALFSGAPAASNYEVFVTADISGNQYSVAQTHEATLANPTPFVAPFSVLEADISTLTFQIGILSDLDITTLSGITEGLLLETFADLSAVASSSDVVANAGDLELLDTAGVYEASGVAFLGPIAPSPILSWEMVLLTGNNPINTLYKVQFYTAAIPTGPFTLIPSTDLAGNSVGFSGSIINLTALDASLYPEIYVGVTLETLDTSVTPKVDEVAVYYRQSETAQPLVDVVVTGTKTIGTNTSAQAIYKYKATSTTDGGGGLSVADIEFDTYTFDVSSSGYDIATACGGHPFVQLAGIDGESTLVLVADSAETLRVAVADGLGQPIPGAAVRVTRTAYDVTIDSNICGQSFFTGGVGVHADYVVNVSALGYVSENIDPFNIDGDTVLSVTLSQ
jgi:type II secretory pathway pseudopilin PulG